MAIVHKDLGPGLKLSVTQRKIVEITSAQLLAMNATAKTLVAAPGPGRVIVPDLVKLQYLPGTVEYTVPAPAAAVTNRLVVSVNLTNTTLTLANQPAFPSRITFTITDTTPSITAGTITILGRDIYGKTVTEVLDVRQFQNLTAASITGKTINIYSSVVSIITAGFTVLGGAGDETIVVGVEPLTGYDLGIKYGSTSGVQIGSFNPVGLFRMRRAFANNSIVVSVNLTNTSLSVRATTATPMDPFNAVVTIVDTVPSITAGTVTLVGTDRAGNAISEDINCAAGAGTYVSALVYATITAAVTKGFTVLGGAGDETIKIGHTAPASIVISDVYQDYSFNAAAFENQALVLATNEGELTGGTGTLRVETRFIVEPLAIDLKQWG